jgi:regulator of replication initiation timing
MKNKYEISQNYILNLENEELRERIKKLIQDYKELKKLYEDKERERLVQIQGDDAIVQK